MKRLYLIRHAKSSWADASLDDFDRPLNKRGKRDSPEMANRLRLKEVQPDLIVASPAKRAKKTAIQMAKGTGYDPARILFNEELYLGSLQYHLQVLETSFKQAETLFLVGHNYTITELAEYLSGTYLGNVPTCGVVAIQYNTQFSAQEGAGTLLFFDYPKNRALETKE